MPSVEDGAATMMAFIDVALDGSGTLSQHKVLSYAGGVTTQAAWSLFEGLWHTALQRHGLRYFKMAEAMTFYGEFQPKYAEWGDSRNEKRDALLRKLVGFADQLEISAIGHAANVAALDNME
jgi:hypothetical protein